MTPDGSNIGENTRSCKYSQVLLMMGEDRQVSSISIVTPAGSNIGENTRSCKYSQVLLMMGEDIARNM
jgi:hypothetical protein